MAISNFDKQQFGIELNKVLSPSQPIQSIENLFGRDHELDKIEKALFAPGRHIFIYGDRGVGKSSLAAAAANQFQSSEAKYIDISASPDSTCYSLVANIAYHAIGISRIKNQKTSSKKTFNFKIFKSNSVEEITYRDLCEEIRSLHDAVEVLKEISTIHSEHPIVVIDEFDQIKSAEERNLFAHLLKNLGDKKVNLKFIFTGVGKTLEELLGAHQSAIRQLETIELPKLSWDARWDIALEAAKAFNLYLDQEICYRIAAVSDGYPYYVHFITEKMLWDVFDDENIITEVDWSHYHKGLRDAIDSIVPELKKPYYQAINKRSSEYEEILWATADSEYLDRDLASMYESYISVIKQRKNSELLPYEKFCARIRKLKEDNFGAILVSYPRNPGFYTYREKMLRGFVRMQAEAHDVKLAGGVREQNSTAQPIRVPTSARHGYRGPSIPSGIRLKGEK